LLDALVDAPVSTSTIGVVSGSATTTVPPFPSGTRTPRASRSTR
jgi:hypothetical protein